MSLEKSKKDQLDLNIEQLEDYILTYPDAKIYIGCDSKRIRKKRVHYATVVIVHYGAAVDMGKGAKIFGEITYDKITDSIKGKPFNRMISEVQKSIEMFQRLEDILLEKIDHVEIHCDINPDDNHGSYVAHGAALGMVQGIIGITPKFKPEAFAASYCSDRFVNI